MQRTKVLAVAAALIAAVTATVLLAGGATAATWHVYEGDVYPGHAYALDVPARAESVEFGFEGIESGSASIAVYAPDGDKVGFYELGVGLPTASVADPDEGRYVLYVYDVLDGALQIRVDSKTEPRALELSEVALARQDHTIGEFPQGKLDQAITIDLKVPTVFATLLYEGSARDLDATVSSAKGPVVVVQDETASAFSPGVWTSLSGTRTFDAANLDGTMYTVEVHATQFEGRMVLTTLGLDLTQPVPAEFPTAPVPPNPTKLPRSTDAPAEQKGAEFALQHLTAVAFDAPAGLLLLVDPAHLACQEAREHEHDEDEENETDAEEADCDYGYGLVSIFAPDDTLVATVSLDESTPTAEIELPVAGEYVAYTHGDERELVLAKIVGLSVAPSLRVLEMEEVEQSFATSSLLFSGEPIDVMLERVPVDIRLSFYGFGAISNAYLENEDGDVASANALFPGLPGTPVDSWTYVEYNNLAAGAHTLTFGGGVFEGDLVLTTLHYVRDSQVSVEEVHEAHAAHEHEHDHEGHEHEGGASETPAPLPGAPVDVAEPLALLGIVL